MDTDQRNYVLKTKRETNVRGASEASAQKQSDRTGRTPAILGQQRSKATRNEVAAPNPVKPAQGIDFMGYPKSTLRPSRSHAKVGTIEDFQGGGGSFPTVADTRERSPGDVARSIINGLARLIDRDTRDDELADPANYFGGGGAGGSWPSSRPLAADPSRPIFTIPGGGDCGSEERDPQGWGHSSYYYVGCDDPPGSHVGYNASASINNDPPPVPWQGGSWGTPSGICNTPPPGGGAAGPGGTLHASPAASVAANGAALVTAWNQISGGRYWVSGTFWLTDGYTGSEDTWDQCLPGGGSGFLPRDPATRPAILTPATDANRETNRAGVVGVLARSARTVHAM